MPQWENSLNKNLVTVHIAVRNYKKEGYEPSKETEGDTRRHCYTRTAINVHSNDDFNDSWTNTNVEVGMEHFYRVLECIDNWSGVEVIAYAVAILCMLTFAWLWGHSCGVRAYHLNIVGDIWNALKSSLDDKTKVWVIRDILSEFTGGEEAKTQREEQ